MEPHFNRRGNCRADFRPDCPTCEVDCFTSPLSARLRFGLVEKSPKTIAHPEIARAIEQELIHALITCLAQDAPLQARPIRARRAAVMTRFEDALAAHPGRHLHMPELCEAVGVCERTLRLCCAEFLDMSPRQYLWLRQLKMVRTELQKAEPATTSVAGAARKYGFGELGRFAGMYRTAYGETPSATLQFRQPVGRSSSEGNVSKA